MHPGLSSAHLHCDPPDRRTGGGCTASDQRARHACRAADQPASPEASTHKERHFNILQYFIYYIVQLQRNYVWHEVFIPLLPLQFAKTKIFNNDCQYHLGYVLLN